MRQLASTLNKVTKTQLVEPFFQQKFAAAGKSLTNFFQLSVVQISAEKEKAQKQKQVIHCKNLENLPNKVLLARDYSTNYFIKLGIDGGGSFLKMSLAVIKVTRPSNYSSFSTIRILNKKNIIFKYLNN